MRASSITSRGELDIHSLIRPTSQSDKPLTDADLADKKSIFFTKEDLKCVNVFVGNDLRAIETLKYCKVQEKMERVMYPESDRPAQHIIQIANDEVHHRGTFLVVTNEQPRKTMTRAADSRNSFFNFT